MTCQEGNELNACHPNKFWCACLAMHTCAETENRGISCHAEGNSLTGISESNKASIRCTISIAPASSFCPDEINVAKNLDNVKKLN